MSQAKGRDRHQLEREDAELQHRRVEPTQQRPGDEREDQRPRDRQGVVKS